ncbi:hypothetical protein ACT80S_18340 [Ramlibacter sp. MAHUQ-53]|uniref:hypothetical protein n=1 Tax=unclassified Ramlibacter TaxID=2617605 RepID=UPI0036381361
MTITREQIVAWAREAGFDFKDRAEPRLEAFAALIEQAVRQDENKQCAYRAGIALLGADRGLANRVNQAIRARGEKQ